MVVNVLDCGQVAEKYSAPPQVTSPKAHTQADVAYSRGFAFLPSPHLIGQLRSSDGE
jgi:hypothetical protein